MHRAMLSLSTYELHVCVYYGLYAKKVQEMLLSSSYFFKSSR